MTSISKVTGRTFHVSDDSPYIRAGGHSVITLYYIIFCSWVSHGTWLTLLSKYDRLSSNGQISFSRVTLNFLHNTAFKPFIKTVLKYRYSTWSLTVRSTQLLPGTHTNLHRFKCSSILFDKKILKRKYSLLINRSKRKLRYIFVNVRYNLNEQEPNDIRYNLIHSGASNKPSARRLCLLAHYLTNYWRRHNAIIRIVWSEHPRTANKHLLEDSEILEISQIY